MNAPRARERAIAVGAALALVIALDAWTGLIAKPVFDGWFYLKMAQYGLEPRPSLVAPFAYRPVVPLAVGAAATLFGVSLQAAFVAAARAGSVLLLWLGYELARRAGARHGHALVIVGLLAASYFHVRHALYFPLLIDVQGMALTLLAFGLLWQGRAGLALAVALPGLWVKEFLVIPALFVAFRAWRDRERGTARAAAMALSVGFAIALFALLPRVWIQVAGSHQFIDPLADPGSLAKLWRAPLDPARLVNWIFSAALYWLPSAMLFTPDRGRAVWQRLGERRALLVFHVLGVSLLGLYGGTNLMIFAAYALPAQVVVLALLMSASGPGLRVQPAELAWVVVAQLLVNRVFEPIPPLGDAPAALHAWADFQGGWSSRVNGATAWRSVGIAACVAAAWGLRGALARKGEAGEGADG